MRVSCSFSKRAGFVSRLHLAEFCVFPAAVARRLGAVALVLACLLGILSPGSLRAQTVTTTITAGTTPATVAVNPVTNKIYVGNEGSNNVTVIDGATNTITTVTDSNATVPYAIAVNTVTNKIYVVNTSSANVTVIDGATNETTTVTVGSNPSGVSVNPVTNKIYVANNGSNNVTVIDGATNTTTTVQDLNAKGPYGVAVNPVTNEIYVANELSNNVTVIDGGTSNKVITTVNVGNQPWVLAVNPVTNKIYVANSNSNTVSVIDGTSNAVTTTVTVGLSPLVVAINPVTAKIYVANSNSNTVSVIDGATNTTTTVTVGSFPDGVAVNPVTNEIYVSNHNSNNVTVINGASNTVTTTVNVVTIPESVAINPVTNKIYVATYTTTSNVTVIDGATNSTATISVGTIGSASDEAGIAINPVTNKIYVPTNGSDEVTVIDGATNATTTVAVTGPWAVDVNPVTDKIYVTSGINSVAVIDGVNNSTTMVSVGTDPYAVAVNPVTNKIYVANYGSNNATVIDGATNSATTISTGSSPEDVAVNPVTNKIYVTNFGSANVTVIDGATNSTTTVSTGTYPYAVAVNPVTNKVYVGNTSGTVTVIDGATNSTTTVSAGADVRAVAVNPVTNKIYAANMDDNTVTVIDGATNSTTTVITGIWPWAMAVNRVTNKIYVANASSANVTVIDGATNSTTTIGAGADPDPVAVNPMTNKIYVANYSSNNVTVITEQQVQPIPLVAAITPLTGNTSSLLAPSFDFTASSTFSPYAPPPDGLYFQPDTWQGVWTPATSQGSGAFTGTTAALLPGFHLLYAYSTDGQDSTSTMGGDPNGATSSLISNITAYGFLVVPPTATLTPTSLNFGSEAVGITSAAQTLTLSSSGATLTIASITITGTNSGDFSETNDCETSLFAGESCTINVIFTPTLAGPESATLTVTDDAGVVSGSTQTVSLTGTGTQQSQTISFPNPGTQTYGATLSLTATATSGLPVSYTVVSGGPATVSGSTLTITGVGSVTVQATQAGNNAWLAATSVSVTFTVNPAVLTVTANNMAMSYVAQVAPTFTASYSGFVNGDTSAVLSGAPILSTTWTLLPTSAAGSYPITVTQGALTAPKYYSLTFVSGTLLITPAANPTLTFLNNYFITGDHIVRSFDPGSGKISNGFVYGTITIPSSSPGQEGVPAGADIVAAFLYWQALETNPTTPSSTNAFFNGYSITGTVVGNDLLSSCWSSGSTPIMRAYRANVLPYLPVVNGNTQAVASHAVAVPANTYGTVPGNASLVIVYRVLSNQPSQYPLKATVIYDGNWSLEYAAGNPSYFNETISGFYDADSSGSAKITDIFGTVVNNGGVGFSPATANGYTWTQTVADDASGITMPNHYALQSGQCNVWAAVVFSTTVKNSDRDGLLDAWKRGPAQGDPHAGSPGYYDVRDNTTWVDLTGAQKGHKDLFVQLDYMVGTDGHSHYPSTDALNMVQSAFANHGITVHFVTGNAITEDTCTDDTSTNPPSLCMFPGEPGVVAWKTGLEVMKAWPANITACANNPTISNCTPRFPIARKDSYHYVLFGHSLALPTWSILSNTLVSIEVTSNVATVTTSAPIQAQSCPTRVTIDGALATPNLNGVYTVQGCSGATFTIPTVNVSDGTYPNTLPEPQLAIYLSTTDTTSGFSDVGGGDTAVTLGKWPTPQSPEKLINQQAGTLMHELGHSLGLTHGGRYYPGGNTWPSFEANCKPNYQSVMSYLFQVDLIQSDSNGTLVLDYSDRVLDALTEGSLTALGLTGPEGPAYPYTKWFSTAIPTTTTTKPQPASSHCDGTPISREDPDQTMYETEDPAYPITWPATSLDINFDGSISVLDGYDDWDNLDLRQIGASGNDNISGMIYLIDGEYRLPIGGDSFGGGGGLRAAGGGGGGLRAAGGGGGGLRAGGGGGGGLRAAGGGGGGLRAAGGGGGGLRAAGGGGGGEPDYSQIDSYARQARAVTTPTQGVVNWGPASFGQIQAYIVERVINNTPTAIACVYVTSSPPASCNGIPSLQPAAPDATSYGYTDSPPIQGATYYVTTVDLDPNDQPRESTPSKAMEDQAALTLSPPNPQSPTLTYNSSETLSTSGGSTGGAVTYNLVSGPCTLSGAALTANSGTGSCSVTATMAGNSTYYPVTSASLTVTLNKATQATLTVTGPSSVAYGSTGTATATGGSGTGALSFSAGSSTGCSVSGTTVSVTNASGTCLLTATKAADNNYNAATSASFPVTLNKVSTATALSATPNPANFGQSVSLTAKVAPVAPGAGTPTGTVTFQDSSTPLTTVTMTNARATFTTSSMAAGTHNLTASYNGDTNFGKSSSAVLAEQVVCGVLISLSPPTVPLGGKVTVTGKVISCANTAQTIVVQFSLSGPLQPNSCTSTKSVIFTTPPFTLPPKTSQTVSFPFPISRKACTGTYSITATTLVKGTPVDISTASLKITAH